MSILNVVSYLNSIDFLYLCHSWLIAADYVEEEDPYTEVSSESNRAEVMICFWCTYFCKKQFNIYLSRCCTAE